MTYFILNLHSMSEREVTCRYMRKSHFPGWGRPFEFNAQLFRRMQRNEEARDVVRF